VRREERGWRNEDGGWKIEEGRRRGSGRGRRLHVRT
jgi:hypothetical protein